MAFFQVNKYPEFFKNRVILRVLSLHTQACAHAQTQNVTEKITTLTILRFKEKIGKNLDF